MRFLALVLLLHACSAAPASPDAGQPPAPARWDGHCLGRKGDGGRVVQWGVWQYVCKKHPSGWFFEQDPDSDVSYRSLDGFVHDWKVVVLRD